MASGSAQSVWPRKARRRKKYRGKSNTNITLLQKLLLFNIRDQSSIWFTFLWQEITSVGVDSLMKVNDHGPWKFHDGTSS